MQHNLNGLSLFHGPVPIENILQALISHWHNDKISVRFGILAGIKYWHYMFELTIGQLRSNLELAMGSISRAKVQFLHSNRLTT